MQTLRYVVSDGIQLATETFGAGPAFIFAHGLTANRQHSRHQLQPLAPYYKVIIYDQRGHGDSTPITDQADYAIERLSGDIGTVMDAYGIAQAVVGGDSMGAATALRFALDNPDRVQALVLSLPAFSDTPHPLRDQLQAVSHDIKARGIEEFVRVSVEEGWRDNGMSSQAIAHWATVLRSHQAASLALAWETVFDWCVLPSLDRLRHFPHPVQIIALSDDAIHPIALALRLQSLFPHTANLITIETRIYYEDIEVIGRHCHTFLECEAEIGRK